MAASFAMKGDSEEAVESLGKAIELNEDNRIYAKNDSDFKLLHNHQVFADLIGLHQIPAEESS
jgi:hypothetical protein